MYLLDTGVVFDLSRIKGGRADPGLSVWAGEIARERLFVSALTLVELESAAAQAGRRDKSGGLALRTWISEQLVPAFDGHVLAIDAAVARRRGELPMLATREALFAATALTHGLTVVTTAPAAYKGARVRLFDPTGYQSDADAGDGGDWRTAGQSRPPWLRNLFSRG
jgi:toxin FitB